MGFKTRQKDVAGAIAMYRFHGWYRLTSESYEEGVSGLDLEDGSDEFLPTTITDVELGAAVRRCHDATRFVDWRTLPKGEAARAWVREWKNSLNFGSARRRG